MAAWMTLPLVSTTPLARDVVPLVNIMMAASSRPPVGSHRDEKPSASAKP